jgi:hypothetical protein
MAQGSQDIVLLQILYKQDQLRNVLSPCKYMILVHFKHWQE